MGAADHELVSLAGISHAFGGVTVLDDVDLVVHPGEVHGLVGENGAGKSTLMKILNGVHSVQHGQIQIDGTNVRFGSPADARRAGIGMVFQEFSLVPSLTVAQNVMLHAEPRTRWGLIDERRLQASARDVFARIGVDVDVTRLMSELGPAQWQLTEVAKVLAMDIKLLVLDEPTSALTRAESAALFDRIRHLSSQGIGVVYISHRMEEILSICDRVTVLRDGKRVMCRPAADLTVESMIEAIVGRASAALEFRGSTARTTTERLSVTNLTTPRLRDVSFTLCAGEVVGLVGLVGSGRSEVLRALFGLDRRTAGEIAVDGAVQAVRSPRQATAVGLALVPEDRRREGLVLDHAVRSNVLLANYAGLQRFGLVDERPAAALVRQLTSRVGVRAASLRMPVNQLSGGNQQKTVVAKWLGRQPKVLLLDEPTAGIDIGAKAEIVELIRTLAAEGTAIIIASSDLPEVLAVSDRLMVLRDGVLCRTIERTAVRDDVHLQQIIQEANAA